MFFLLPLWTLSGCGGGPPVRKAAPLSRAERDLFQETEMNLKAGRETWWASWKKIAARPDRAELFAKGLVAWLFRDFSRKGVSPDLFGTFLEKDPRGLVWKRVLAGLGRMGDPAVRVVMLFIRRGRDPIARGMGAQIAGRMGPAIVPALVKELKEGPPLAAAASADALGYHKESPQAGKALLEAATGARDYRVRGAALRALGRFGGPDSRALLVETLQTAKDPFLVLEAAKGLGLLGEKKTVPALISALEKAVLRGDRRLARVVEKSLQEITGRRFGPRAELWRVWWAREVRAGNPGIEEGGKR